MTGLLKVTKWFYPYTIDVTEEKTVLEEVNVLSLLSSKTTTSLKTLVGLQSSIPNYYNPGLNPAYAGVSLRTLSWHLESYVETKKVEQKISEIPYTQIQPNDIFSPITNFLAAKFLGTWLKWSVEFFWLKFHWHLREIAILRDIFLGWIHCYLTR